MKTSFIIFLISFSIGLSAQIPENRHDRIKRKEFKELENEKAKFIPSNIQGSEVIIIRYPLDYIKNERDSVEKECRGFKEQLTEEQLEKHLKSLNYLANDYPELLKRKLTDKGINAVIVDKENLMDLAKYDKKHILLTASKCSQEERWWYITTTNYFYDSDQKKYLRTFLPTNYNILDLIEKRH